MDAPALATFRAWNVPEPPRRRLTSGKATQSKVLALEKDLLITTGKTRSEEIMGKNNTKTTKIENGFNAFFNVFHGCEQVDSCGQLQREWDKAHSIVLENAKITDLRYKAIYHGKVVSSTLDRVEIGAMARVEYWH